MGVIKVPNILIMRPLKDKHLDEIRQSLPDYEVLLEPEEAKLAETEIIVHWTPDIQELWKQVNCQT